MEYTHNVENGIHLIHVTDGTQNVFFNADPNSDLPEHSQMIAVFDSTPDSIPDFAEMLISNPDSAFTNFINKYISNQ